MTETLDASRLKAKFDELGGDVSEDVRLRIRRAISWIERAEAEEHDADVRFIFLWIAFNAAYAKEIEFQPVKPDNKSGARTDFREYFEKLVASGHENRIYNALWEEFRGPVQALMTNRFVFQPFWKYHNRIKGYENWKDRFRDATRWFTNAFKRRKCVDVLDGVFDRLYVLRNQMVHGGATWNSELNRDQVRDGAAILGFLIPIFVDIMMDNPSRLDWGKPFYPRVRVPLN